MTTKSKTALPVQAGDLGNTVSKSQANINKKERKYQLSKQQLRRLQKSVLVTLALSGHLPETACEWLIYAGGLNHV